MNRKPRRSITRFRAKEFYGLFNELDRDVALEPLNETPDGSDLREALKNYVKPGEISQRAILGIDIYKYSQYAELEQTLIPMLYKMLYDGTVESILDQNKFVFQKLDKAKIRKQFISTGDGGFQIFDTPLHALFFATIFSLHVRAYNSFHLYPKLRAIVGPITLRYALTFDNVFAFEQNFYGSAIINNARILSRDSLNRFLLDGKTYEWFMSRMQGIETLQGLQYGEVQQIPEFQGYNYAIREEHGKGLLTDGVVTISGKGGSPFRAVDILHVGTIRVKGTSVDIYNLHLQAEVEIFETTGSSNRKRVVVSLGNLNTAGIDNPNGT